MSFATKSIECVLHFFRQGREFERWEWAFYVKEIYWVAGEIREGVEEDNAVQSPLDLLGSGERRTIFLSFEVTSSVASSALILCGL